MASNCTNLNIYKIPRLPTNLAHEVHGVPSLQIPARKRIAASLLGSSFTGMGATASFCSRQRVKSNPLFFRYVTSEDSGKFRVKAAGASFSAPFSPDLLSTAEGRALLAEEYGFRQIGEPVPKGVTLKDVFDSLPAEVFEMNPWKAWRNVIITVTAYGLGLFCTAHSPWYMLPFAWAWTGTAAAGLFTVGHDCGHKCFSKNKLLEDIIGTIAMMPIIYPYEAWRFEHNIHHANTNMLVVDTAWHPIMREDWETYPEWYKAIAKLGLGPFRPWAAIVHWYTWHFDSKLYRPNEQNRVKISVAAVCAFIVLGWPAIIYFTGISGWINFWLMPWLGYQFWMSTFTMVHHTAPHIPFKDASEWNAADAQLGGTVHCDYPRWVEVLAHDVNVHIPHHISQSIPSYNLRLATDSIRQNWGKHLTEATWNWRLMKTIMAQCHIYEDRKYMSFDEGVEESKILGTLRKLMPDTT